MANVSAIAAAVAFVVAGVAALWDWRTGRIPNWLTLPPLVVAPLVYAVVVEPRAALTSLLSAAICGLVPYILFRQRAMGGGDVKLFAALGAVTGFDLRLGLEIELAAFFVGALFAMGKLAYDGKLMRTLGNTFFLTLNPVLPRGWRREVTPELMSTIRMGVPIFIGAGLMTFSYLSRAWLLA